MMLGAGRAAGPVTLRAETVFNIVFLAAARVAPYADDPIFFTRLDCLLGGIKSSFVFGPVLTECP